MHRQREEDCASIEHTESAMLNSPVLSVGAIFMFIAHRRLFGHLHFHLPNSGQSLTFASQPVSQSVYAPIVKLWPLFFQSWLCRLATSECLLLLLL